MKSHLRLRQSLAAATIVLAGCSAAQNVSPSVGAGSNSRLGSTPIVFDHAKFRAAYSGSYGYRGDCSDTKIITYSGSGHAEFLRSSSEAISLTWNCGAETLTGSATLTSTTNPRNSITASLSASYVTNLCALPPLSFTITGGSGRFRHATGSGTLNFVEGSSYCFFYYEYADKWRGTLRT